MPKTAKIILQIDRSRETERRFLSGIARYAAENGPWEFYIKPLPDRENKIRSGDELWFRNIPADGIITRGLEYIEQIVKMNIPVIGSGIYRAGHPGVSNTISDSKQIGRMAAEHLLDCGLWNFAYCGLTDIYWSQARSESFAQEIAKAGFNVDFYRSPNQKKPVSVDQEKAYLAQWLRSLKKPVGIMACNDERAMQIIEACKTVSIKIPEDVAVLGVDNDELICNICSPALSSISVNFEQAGFQAAQLLDELMSGKKTSANTIFISPTHIIARQSTDILNVKDKDVADAIRFIYDNWHNNLQVNDVVAKTTLSRRVLEKRFRKVLKRSINEELRRVRINNISRMLMDTNLTITQIASRFDWTDTGHISRYF
ncbi:MAG: substrate-binding domain-containing protein, partial [Sedimentisphaerales bacterium]|nr:substrate-binding domain-containing protein [Sedimentisphaerales bacterium]